MVSQLPYFIHNGDSDTWKTGIYISSGMGLSTNWKYMSLESTKDSNATF